VADHADFKVNKITAVVGSGIRNPEVSLTIAKRA